MTLRPSAHKPKETTALTPPERRAARFRILPVTLGLLGLMAVSKTSDVYLGIQAIQSAAAAEEKAEKEEAAHAEEGASEEGGHGGEAKK